MLCANLFFYCKVVNFVKKKKDAHRDTMLNASWPIMAKFYNKFRLYMTN